MVNNNTKVWMFILISSLLFLVLGHQIGDRLGLFLGFTCALLLNVFVFIFGDARILQTMKAKKISGQDPYSIQSIVFELCKELRIQPPQLYVTPHAPLNSFCAGAKFRKSSLVFTQGLLDKLSADELRAVIAHQLFHLQTLNSLKFNVTSTFANTIVGIGQFLDNVFLKKIQLFSKVLAPFGEIILRISLRKSDFLENDQHAAALLGNREQLGQVLWKLEGLSQTTPLKVPLCSEHLFIVNPNGLNRHDSFLKAHPTLKSRIKKLMGYYPI